jgi:hypothetical protein
MAGILMVLGLIVALVGWIWLLIEAFKENVLWGLGCFFFSPVSLFFAILNWDVAKKPCLINLAGTAITLIGAFLGSSGS